MRIKQPPKFMSHANGDETVRWLEQKLAEVRPAITIRLYSASDAPVVTPPGHRRGTALYQNKPFGAALPQPPLISKHIGT